VQIARHLPPELQATIVTHSPSVAVELAQHKTVDVVIIGGRLFKHSVVAAGAAAIEALARIQADIYFMGVTGIHPKVGLTTGDWEEAHIKRALCARASETIVLISSEKLGVASPYVILPVAQISGMIVEKGIDAASILPYSELGISVTYA
jgi:DeoR/GlpR family transcriptional regulator of sugar metabolism